MLTRDGKNVDFTQKETKFLYPATYKLKNVDFRSKKGLNVDFTLMCDGKDVNFTQKGAKCLSQATYKLKNVDFRSKQVKILNT